MGFQTESKKVDLNDIRQQVKSTNLEISSFASANDKAMGNYDTTGYDVRGNGIFGLFDFSNSYQDTTGIDGAKVPEMQTAIEDYVKSLQDHLKRVKTETSSKKAYAGAYAESVEKYVQSICDACEAIISNLLMFNDKLTEIKEAYAKRAEEIATDISTQSTKMGSTFTGYKG